MSPKALGLIFFSVIGCNNAPTRVLLLLWCLEKLTFYFSVLLSTILYFYVISFKTLLLWVLSGRHTGAPLQIARQHTSIIS